MHYLHCLAAIRICNRSSQFFLWICLTFTVTVCVVLSFWMVNAEFIPVGNPIFIAQRCTSNARIDSNFKVLEPDGYCFPCDTSDQPCNPSTSHYCIQMFFTKKLLFVIDMRYLKSDIFSLPTDIISHGEQYQFYD